MVNCPIKQCGRKFENDETMLEHVRRRHPEQYNAVRQDTTKSLIEKQHAQQQQLSKLPKLAKLMSKQTKPMEKAMEMPIRSSSKTRKLQSTNLSNIIQQSRMATGSTTTTISSIATRRPSLTKKLSSSDMKTDKLPPIQKQLKKTMDSTVIQPIKKPESNQRFYTTLQDFKSKSIKLKSSSKDKKEEVKKTQIKESQPAEPLSLRNTMTAISSKRSIEEVGDSKKKAYLRPTKKVEKKLSQKDKPTEKALHIGQQFKPDFDQRTVTIRSWPQSIFICPSPSKIQILFLNNCNLSDINLNSLQSLIELSAIHNKLRDMQFLRYTKNHNIKIVHLDHNEITEIYTPPRLKILTVSFNQIKAQGFQEVCSVLRKSPDVEEIDFSFNGVRKAENYKLKLLAICPRLKKIDGLTVTRIDIEMMEEYLVLESKQKGLIPLGSPSQDRPSTAISQFESDPNDTILISKTIAQLEKQQKQYEKLISETETQLKIIKEQNEIISGELQQLKAANKELQSGWDSANLLKKLQKQCEFLELLNIIQYADEEELAAMVGKKKMELGILID